MMKVFLFAKAASAEAIPRLRNWLASAYLDQLQQSGLPLQRYVLNTCDLLPQFRISPFIAQPAAHQSAYDLGVELWLDQQQTSALCDSHGTLSAELRALFLYHAENMRTSFTRLDIFFVTENVCYAPLDGAATDIKFMALGCWHEHLSDAEGRHHWTEHAKLVPRVHIGVNKYVQNWVEESLMPDAPTVTGIAELHFPSLAVMENEFYISTQGQEEIRRDVVRFTKSAITLFAREALVYQKF